MIESSSEKLIDLLNTEFTPQKEFTDKNLRFETPAEEVTEDYNTKMVVKGVPGKGYYGSVELKFRRVPLSVIGDDVELRKEGQFTMEEICDMLNSSRNTFISEPELEPIEIPNLTVGQSFVIKLIAKSDSMGWTGSQDITIRFGKPFLSVVIARNSLVAVTPPGERYDVPAAWALLFYQDFTAFRDSLKIDPKTGRFVDATAIHEVTHKLGIPSWAEMWPGDYPTSAIPESNQAFDRVVRQDYVGSGKMAGPIFFHYNTVKFDGA
jgi:hypothetical protein